MLDHELVQAIDRVIRFLEDHEEWRWPPILSRFRARCQSLPPEAIEEWKRLLREMYRMFGGMGSLQDLNLSRINGHKVIDETFTNAKFSELLDDLYRLIEAAASRCGLS